MNSGRAGLPMHGVNEAGVRVVVDVVGEHRPDLPGVSFDGLRTGLLTMANDLHRSDRLQVTAAVASSL